MPEAYDQWLAPALFHPFAVDLARRSALLHDFAVALVAGLARAFPDDPPTFIMRVPHGYADVDVVAADLIAGGMECASAESVVLQRAARSAADVAVGFCTGTPVRTAIEARGDLAAAIAAVTREMESRLGPGPVTGRMAAHVIEARPQP